MTFNPNIPQPNDLISQSQAQIQTNFSQSDTAFGIDHTAFSTVSNQGKHKKSSYIEQASDPVTSANEVAVYSKELSGASTLYLRKENAGTVVQMSGQDPTVAAAGSTFLPGGVILKWGSGSVTNTQTVNFASAFPTACWQVILQPINNGAVTVANDYVYVASFNTTGFSATAVRRITLAGNTVAFSYIAIGN